MINSPEYHAAKTKRDALETEIAEVERLQAVYSEWHAKPAAVRSQLHHGDGDARHPYNACQDVAAFRRKYGMVVLLYASNQSEEQNMRTSTCKTTWTPGPWSRS